jgi:hypothetical protein
MRSIPSKNKTLPSIFISLAKESPIGFILWGVLLPKIPFILFIYLLPTLAPLNFGGFILLKFLLFC